MSARRTAVLREMGLAPIWRLRGAVADAPLHDLEPMGETVEPQPEEGSESTVAPSGATAAPQAAAGRPSADKLPVDALQPHGGAAAGNGTDNATRTTRIAQLDWDALEADIRNCTTCRLYEQRRQAIPGAGDRQGDWMVVGDAPGAEEDRRGEPFGDPASQLLDAMLAAIGLQRGTHVYITTAVKCHPPLNRMPTADEIAACRPYLERQVALVQPRILIALGKPAAQALLDTEVRISAARGKVFEYRRTPVVVTYPPAYLLRNPTDKGKAWEDLCLARRVIGDAGKG